MFTALGGMIPNPIGTISEFRRNCHSTGKVRREGAGSNPNYLLGAMLRNGNSCRLGRSIVATPLLS
jgi:hypothetical protein